MRMQPISDHPDERMRLHCGAERSSPRGREFVFFANFAADATYEPFGHVYSYRPDRDVPWMYAEIESFIHRATAGRLLPDGPDYVFLLSIDGEFWALSEPGQSFGDTIPGAGTWSSDGLGDTHSIAVINGVLYVGGASGQIYRRAGGAAGQWEDIGTNLTGGDGMIIGTCVDTAGNLYALSRRPAAKTVRGRPNDAVLYVQEFDRSWQSILTIANENVSAAPVPAIDEGVLVAIGREGVFAVRRDGSSNTYASLAYPTELGSLALYGNSLYAASGLLHVQQDGHLVRQTWPSAIAPSTLGRSIGGNIGSTHLSIGNDAVLSVGRSDDHTDIARFRPGAISAIEFPIR